MLSRKEIIAIPREFNESQILLLQKQLKRLARSEPDLIVVNFSNCEKITMGSETLRRAVNLFARFGVRFACAMDNIKITTQLNAVDNVDLYPSLASAYFSWSPVPEVRL